MSVPHGNLIVSTPYRENSIAAIARAAASGGSLARFYTTIYTPGRQGTAPWLPAALRRRFRMEAGRRGFSGVPSDSVATAAAGLELLHVLSRRALGARFPRLATHLMYRVKAHFDTAVARSLMHAEPAAFIGMYAAAAESLRVAKKRGAIAAINFVNSHPADHNRYLRELGGVRGSHHEVIPESVIRRVDSELGSADLVLVPSQFVASQLYSHGVARERVATIPYGVDLAAFRSVEIDQTGGRDRAEPKTVHCLYLGQISHRKGIRILVEAARRCRKLPARFSLVGPLVSPEVLEGLPDNVRYEGSAHPAGVPGAMCGADVFILPTLEDSFGLVVLEAMACGLPVITTVNAGASEMITNGHDGLVVAAGDPAALASAIHQLVDDAPARRKIGAAGKRKARGDNSWTAYGNAVLNLPLMDTATRPGTGGRTQRAAKYGY